MTSPTIRVTPSGSPATKPAATRDMFKHLTTSALFAGLAAGVFATLLQLTFVTPLLLEGELFETGARVHYSAEGIQSPADAPALWGEFARHFGTFAMNLVTYTGFAFVIVGLFLLATRFGKKIDARTGAIWGACTFVAISLAPGFGLPPELPGTVAAELDSRQTWWLSTALATAIGLGLFGYGRSIVTALLGLVLIAAPHFIGAPHLDTYYGIAPPELATLFAVRTLGVSAAVFVTLGWLTGYFWSRDTV